MISQDSMQYRSGALGWLLAGVLCLSMVGALQAVPAAAQTNTVLQGYVFNYDGERVPGAALTLFKLPEHVAAGPQAIADAKGEFSLDTGTGVFALRADAAGYTFGEQTVYATSYQTGITFVLRPATYHEAAPLVATVSGQVMSQDNVPLGGISIVSTMQEDIGVSQVTPAPAFSATYSDENGHYTVQVPAGNIWMTVRTGAVWGYQLKPMQISAGQVITDANFVVAIRVLPREAFPTPTPVPESVVSPIIAPGMPTSGVADRSLAWGLAGFGLLALLVGTVLAVRTRRA